LKTSSFGKIRADFYARHESIFPIPSDPNDHGRYSYLKSNPLTYGDPSGGCSYAAEIGICDFSH
jgi:hypothetical protein